jgi:hypothetical protein
VYDFLTIIEAPSKMQMAAALLAAAGSSGDIDLRTTLAMTSIEAKGAFVAAVDLLPGYRSPGRAWRTRAGPAAPPAVFDGEVLKAARKMRDIS